MSPLPAPHYEPCHDLWTVTCLFNPGGYRSKLDNYHRFAAPFRAAGLRLVTVECAIAGAPFQLAGGADVLHVRSSSSLWQKERLLNIAISRMAPAAKKVAWVDGDLLFSNPAWAVETSRLLEHVHVAQPFRRWHRLTRDGTVDGSATASGLSFAQQRVEDARSARGERHGLPGFAWAARRDLLDRHGLYDACVIGGADHVMAHAFSGSTDTVCVRRTTGLVPPRDRRLARMGRAFRHLVHGAPATPFSGHLDRWSKAVHADVQGRIGAVAGDVLHLWHGDASNRRYHDRHYELRTLGFDPDADLWKNDVGCWEWASGRPDLRRWAHAYFQGRREDG